MDEAGKIVEPIMAAQPVEKESLFSTGAVTVGITTVPVIPALALGQ